MMHTFIKRSSIRFTGSGLLLKIEKGKYNSSIYFQMSNENKKPFSVGYHAHSDIAKFIINNAYLKDKKDRGLYFKKGDILFFEGILMPFEVTREDGGLHLYHKAQIFNISLFPDFMKKSIEENNKESLNKEHTKEETPTNQQDSLDANESIQESSA